MKHRRIVVGGFPTGLHGLDEVFAALYAEGRRPGDPDLGQLLVARMGEHNYIPSQAADTFAEALLREYRAYVAARTEGEAPSAPQYGTWRGYPREHIPWFPTVDADRCNGCALCWRLCASHALVPVEGKAVVEDPFRCVVGCSSCANVCRPGAITFPPRSMLDAYPPRR